MLSTCGGLARSGAVELMALFRRAVQRKAPGVSPPRGLQQNRGFQLLLLPLRAVHLLVVLMVAWALLLPVRIVTTPLQISTSESPCPRACR